MVPSDDDVKDPPLPKPPSSEESPLLAAGQPRSSSTEGQPKFECNICFDLPVEPVVTRCGHMYCWRCLHAWLNRGSVECPVCKAGVSRENIIPLYVGGCSSHPASPSNTLKDSSTSSSSSSNSMDGSSSLPTRPRPERPAIPPGHRGVGSSNVWFRQPASPSIQFGLFPFGVGVTFSSFGSSRPPERPLTQEERMSHYISTGLIMLGLLVTFWAVFVGPYDKHL